MNSVNLLSYLKRQDLLDQAKKASLKLRSVLTQCLGAREEEIVILTDYGRPGSMISPVIGAGYHLAAKSLGLRSRLLVQKEKEKGDLAERHIEIAMDELPFRSVIILTANALGTTPQIGKSFRKYALARKHKYISCTGLSSLRTGRLDDILNSIDLDYPGLWKKAETLKEAIDRGDEIRVTNPSGTDLWVGIEGKEAITNDGHYVQPGTGGNMPTGEIYLAPRKKKVEGRVVIDGSSRYLTGTSIIREPITLTVEGGEVTRIEGGREAEMLQSTIDWAEEHGKYTWGIRRLCEFGLGLNPRAKIIGAMVVDEKTANTGHVAIGSNHWFGGTVYAIIHVDQVFRNPTIEVDGKKIDKNLYTY